MLPVIEKDLSLMRMMAGWVEKLSADGKRLKPREVVAEFDNYLHDELDLVREAANAAQLRRNMEGLNLVEVPIIHWDFCHPEVMVMERMNGVPISQVQRLRDAGVDIPSWRAMASPFSSPRCSATVFPCRHAPRQHPGQPGPGHVRALYLAGLWHRRHTHRVRQGIPGAELLPRSSGATTSAWPNCTSRAAGFRPVRGSTNSRAPSARSASRTSTVRSKKFRWAWCSCACSRRRGASTWRFSPSSCCCKDAAQHRGTGPPARPGAGFVEHGQAVSGKVDARPARPQRFRRELRAQAPHYAKIVPSLPRFAARFPAAPTGTAAQPRAAGVAQEQRHTNRLLQGLVYVCIGFVLGLIVMQVLVRVSLF